MITFSKLGRKFPATIAGTLVTILTGVTYRDERIALCSGFVVFLAALALTAHWDSVVTENGTIPKPEPKPQLVRAAQAQARLMEADLLIQEANRLYKTPNGERAHKQVTNAVKVLIRRQKRILRELQAGTKRVDTPNLNPASQGSKGRHYEQPV